MKYFVSGISSRGQFGAEIDRDAPICGVRDLKSVQRELESRHSFSECVVLNWRRFEEPERDQTEILSMARDRERYLAALRTIADGVGNPQEVAKEATQQ